jgi:hypothetical protein
MGKLVVIALLTAAALAGGGLWYSATRAYYAPVEGPVTLTLWRDGAAEAIPVEDVAAIASSSSPLGFRACFAHAVTLDAAPEPRPDPAPTIAPGWFDCFDAEAVAALIRAGQARAFTGYENVAYGVDRVVALAEDGRGWAWHELNDCGERSYDGTVVGEACPDRETFQPLTEGAP